MGSTGALPALDRRSTAAVEGSLDPAALGGRTTEGTVMTSSPITRKCATLFALSALAVAITAPAAPAFTGPSTPSQQSQTSQDLRSPDTRDAATGYAPKPVPV